MDRPGQINDNLFTVFCRWGDGGVPLFFVISGYCIAAAAANTLDRKQSVVQFIQARARRIFPPYWIMLLFVILMMAAATFAQQRGLISNSSMAEGFTTLNAWKIITNSALVQVPLKQGNIHIVAWTLSYEIAFYAVMAIGVAIFHKQGWHRMIQVLHVITVSSFFLVVFVPNLVFFPFKLWMNFGEGVLLFDLLCGQSWKERSANEKLFYGGIAFAMSALMVLYITYNQEDKSAWQNAIALLFAALLYFLHPFDRYIGQARWLRWLLSVGSFSYSLYLTHFPIVGLLRQVAKKNNFPIQMFAFEMLAELVVSIALAYVFYLLVESRFIRTKAKHASNNLPDPIVQTRVSLG